MSEKLASDCDPLQFALHIAAASDKLAQLHRSVEATDVPLVPESDIQKASRAAAAQLAPNTVAEKSSQSVVAARKMQIAKLAERVAAAAETLAQVQQKVAAKDTQAAISSGAAPSAAKVTQLVAKEARQAADRQARCSAVPEACEVTVLGPEWMQQQLKRQLLSPAGAGELDQVRPVSNRHMLSLTCPLSGGFLKVPTRGLNCQHIDCFDLSSLRQSAPTGWRCPMIGCTASVAPAMLRRDSFVEAVLLKSSVSMRAIALSSDLAGFQTTGSPGERARILADRALSLDPSAQRALCPLAGLPIEIEDSDSEMPPQSKSSEDSDCRMSPQMKRLRRRRRSPTKSGGSTKGATLILSSPLGGA